jgi:hypothetical protein
LEVVGIWYVCYTYAVSLVHIIDVGNMLNSKWCQYLGKALPITGRGGPLGYETSRLPHFLNSRLTVGGEVVSLMRRPLFYLQ